MITPEEMIRRLRSVRRTLVDSRKRDALVIGLDSIAQVKRRVINTGISHEDKTFGVYSQSYQAFRARNNLTSKPFPLVNFKKTTRMWNNTTASIIDADSGSVTVRLAPTTPGEQQKLEWNEERFGAIIALNDREQKRVENAIRKRYTRHLINNIII